MRIRRFHFAVTVVFALGFVLVGSGWSFVLSSMMNDRPEWSVCGQDLCLCVPQMQIGTAEQVDDSDCPLCESGAMEEPGQELTTTVGATRRVPKNNGALYALNTGAHGMSIAFFVTTMIGQGSVEIAGWDMGKLPKIADEAAPCWRALELDTPPPRG